MSGLNTQSVVTRGLTVRCSRRQPLPSPVRIRMAVQAVVAAELCRYAAETKAFMGNSEKGHYLVCPDFGPDGKKLSNDTQARCLSYIFGHINEIATIPPGIRLEVIALRWHHFGEAYPSIGIPAEGVTQSIKDMTLLSFKLGDQITEFIKTLGLERLVELSAGEAITWAEVLKSQEP